MTRPDKKRENTMKKSDVSRLKKVAKSRALVEINGTGLVSNGFITSTNLEIFISLKCDVRGEGIINLADIEKPYSEAWIDGGFLFVKRNGAVMKSPVIDSEEFPIIPGCEPNCEFIEFNQVSDFKTLSNFVGKDEMRPAMMGIFFNKSEMAATDAHRMMWVKLSTSNPFEGIIIPATIAPLLSQVDYRITKNDKYAFFTNAEETIVCRMIYGSYPNYEAVIPVKEDEYSFSFQKSEMITQIESALPSSNENVIAFRFKNGLIDIVTKNVEANTEYSGQIKQTLHESEKQRINPDEEFICCFDGKLMLSVLKVIEQSTVKMHYSAFNRPFIFDENKLLMPVMVKTESENRADWFFNPSIQPEENTVENAEEVEVADLVSPENESPEAPVEVPSVNDEESIEEVIEEAEIVEEFPSFEEDASSPITDHPSPITQKPNVIIVQDFTPKSFIVIGETAPLAEQFEKIYGKFTRNLRIGDSKFDGFWFSNKRLNEAMAIIQNA